VTSFSKSCDLLHTTDSSSHILYASSISNISKSQHTAVALPKMKLTSTGSTNTTVRNALVRRTNLRSFSPLYFQSTNLMSLRFLFSVPDCVVVDFSFDYGFGLSFVILSLFRFLTNTQIFRAFVFLLDLLLCN
jgi:hypothetical protein